MRLIIGLCLTAFILSACNTVGGAGEDIEAAGEAVQEAAR